MSQERRMGRSITMQEARVVIEAMLEAAKKTKADPSNPMANAAMGLAVVDTSGAPVYLVRMDGASALNSRVAVNKAYTCIDTRRDTVDSENMLKKTGWDIFHFGESKLSYIPGGVLLREKDGSIIGAVGTSGRAALGPMGDEELARIGAKALSEFLSK